MSNKIAPFLRWAGGKTKLVEQILEYVPADYHKRKYWEPFLGGGSLFFALQPQKGVLSDLNYNLINCYERVKSNPEYVHKILRELVDNNSEEFYYKVRDKFNLSNDSYVQAARFIYLNKTCYNGLYRENNAGKFNVPYGHIKSPAIATCAELKKISTILKNVNLFSGSFEYILKKAKKGDFVYLDPPYPPLNATAFFNHYTKSRFNHEHQVMLRDLANNLKAKGCLILISNADTKEIRELYKEWRVKKLSVTRWINCKAERIKAKELVIMNY